MPPLYLASLLVTSTVLVSGAPVRENRSRSEQTLLGNLLELVAESQELAEEQGATGKQLIAEPAPPQPPLPKEYPSLLERQDRSRALRDKLAHLAHIGLTHKQDVKELKQDTSVEEIETALIIRTLLTELLKEEQAKKQKNEDQFIQAAQHPIPTGKYMHS